MLAALLGAVAAAGAPSATATKPVTGLQSW
jgi:hypothetical protein